MKNRRYLRLSTLCVAIFFCAIGAYGNNPTISEKVLKAFHETYTTAQQVHWHEKGDQYSVCFLQSDIRYIVNYDNNGNVTGSMRFYKPALLPTNIILEIKRQYSTKTAFGVTEITDGENLSYFVKMEDSKHLYTIKLDAYGRGRVYEKFRKQ
jgi:hypothetical protein